jgi:hypothetical protein
MRTGFYFSCTTQSDEQSENLPTPMLLQQMSHFSLHRWASVRLQSARSRCMPPGRHVCLFFCWYGVRLSPCPICQPHSYLISARGALAPSAHFLCLPSFTCFVFMLHSFRSPTAASIAYYTALPVAALPSHIAFHHSRTAP